jgi:hypothetical protein
LAPAVRADNAAQAEVLFNAARKLHDEGNFAEACPKFQASFDLDEQLGTLFNIADCFEKLEKWATAWARYDAALEWAERDKDDRIAFIRAGRDRVAPKVPKVVIAVSRPAPGLHVRQDDTKVIAAMYGLPLPVDPGPFKVVVMRGDVILEEHDAVAKEGATATIELDLAAIATKHPKSSAEPVAKETPDKPQEPYDPTHRNVGLIVGGVGLVAVIVAGGLEIGALVKKGQAETEDACVNKFCSADGLDAADDAKTFAEVGQWVGIGGLVTLAVGATIFFTAPSEPDEPVAAWRVQSWAGVEGAGLVIEGAF